MEVRGLVKFLPAVACLLCLTLACIRFLVWLLFGLPPVGVDPTGPGAAGGVAATILEPEIVKFSSSHSSSQHGKSHDVVVLLCD